MRDLKINQEKLEKKNQDLHSLVANINTLVKEELTSVKEEMSRVKEEMSSMKGEVSSVKTLLTQLISLTKTQPQMPETPNTQMDVDTPQSMPKLTPKDDHPTGEGDEGEERGTGHANN